MLDAISGKIDIQDRHIDTLPNKPTLVQNAQKGGYRLFELNRSRSNQCQIYLNITHKDPKMREMFANKDFRSALSLGINRKEIIDIVYLGQSEPFQIGPRPGHPWYHEKHRAPVHRLRRRRKRTRSSTGSATSATRRASACVPTGRSSSSRST